MERSKGFSSPEIVTSLEGSGGAVLSPGWGYCEGLLSHLMSLTKRSPIPWPDRKGGQAIPVSQTCKGQCEAGLCEW